MDQPDVRYFTAGDGVSLAYTLIGEGPPLVRVPGVPSHVTAWDEVPGIAGVTRSLAREHQVVAYDPRGMGLSQRVLDFSLDTRVSDLRAVVRHLKLDRFALMGVRHACVPAIAYAARYRDEVSLLVLLEPYADAVRLYETGKMFAAYAALESVTLEQWDFIAMTLASQVTGYSDAEVTRATATRIQASMSAEGYIAFRHANRRVNVVEELGHIVAPTLVMGTEGSELVPLALSQEVAARIPNARFQLTAPHGPSIAVEQAADERILDFLRPPGAAKPAQEASAPASVRDAPGGTAIILFADIVGSTALTERIGDAAFRVRARDLDTALRAIIADAGGTTIDAKTLGDGVLATFPGASQAIETALRCSVAGEAHGLPLHLGLHAGDVIRESNNIFGGAVNIASRISGLSAPGEVLVSRTVADLARTSAGVTFQDRGEHTLKGVSEPQRLYAALRAAG